MPQMEQDWRSVNVNWLVRVRLTDHGRDVFARYLEYINLPRKYRAPKKETDGWSEWSMHELMHIFGEYTGMGLPLCFDTEIQIRFE